MEKTIFEYLDFRAYLLGRIQKMPKGGRGARVAIAQAMTSTVSHISQVLSGLTQLSLEQAEALNPFLGHTDEESDFFILLVQYSRAGTDPLAKRLHQQILRAQQKRLVLKERLGVRTEILPQDQAQFYSSWIYGAVHVMVTIPEFQSREAISEYLGVSPKRIGEILEFLISIGLVVRGNKSYTIGTSRIHLGNDSPMISKFHTNWRLKAIQSLEGELFKDDLHYSSVITVSDSDCLQIKSLLVRQIDEIKKIIRDSKEQGVHSFSLDFFRL